MIQIVFLSLVLIAQNGFDTARVHNHVTSATYEGAWVKRLNLPADNGTQYLLGNGLAVRGATNELWFFYEFKPTDGPLIAMMESRVGSKVRVNYDPSCFYILSLTDITPASPSPTPSPTPLPSPPPVPRREATWFVWPSNTAARKALWLQKGAEGWECFVYDGVLFCSR